MRTDAAEDIMSDRFNDSQMLKLVQAYQEYPCLWNVTSDYYKNRKARDNAYTEIWKKLNINQISIKDIPKKIKNMRSSYYQELRRIEKSKNSDCDLELYKPRVSWFSIADGFLRPFTKQEFLTSSIEDNSNISSDPEPESRTQMKDSNNEVAPNSYRNNTEDDYNEMCIEFYQNEGSPPEFTLVQPIKKVKKENEADNYDNFDIIEKNVTSLNTATALGESPKKDDAYDIFGKYIAETLRSLPGELAIIAKTNIQKVLSDMETRALRESTQSTSFFYATSTSYNP